MLAGGVTASAHGLVWPFFNVAFSNVLALMVNAKDRSNEIDNYCLLFLLVAILGAAAVFSSSLMFGISAERLVYDLRVKLFEELLRAPVSFYDKKENTPGQYLRSWP